MTKIKLTHILKFVWVQITRIFSHKSSLFYFLSLLLAFSLGSNLFLFFQNKQLVQKLYQLEEESTFKRIDEIITEPGFDGEISLEEYRIGTDPESVISRIFHAFYDEVEKMNPVCNSTSGRPSLIIVYQNDKPYYALSASKLSVELENHETALVFFDKILTLFESNLYNVSSKRKVEVKFLNTSSDTTISRVDISHPEKNIVCSVELVIGGGDGSNKTTKSLGKTVEISCAKLDEENISYISMQKEIISDLSLGNDSGLMVTSYTKQYAMVRNSTDTCMILKKTTTGWIILDSQSCHDPSWNSTVDPLTTVLNRDYGIPAEDAEILASYRLYRL